MPSRLSCATLALLFAACGSTGDGSTGDESGTGSGTAATSSNTEPTSTEPTSTEPTSSGSTGDPLRFTPDVWPILQVNCLRCHETADGEMTPGPPSPKPGLVLGADDPAFAYAALINKPAVFAPALIYVVPGSVATSYLFHKLAGTQASVGGVGGSMPPGGMLTVDDMATIEAWIDGGALE
ncbi:hypothetical protein [Nannocystis sp.]|uniref:hypothetical protein n=1 Tax=Nannocystis sp. TaxID=1962667 RepID=UPI0025D71CAC|nr:hypothetical protein [Nannocystis sp.]MBK7827890.1 hypothetical protein [Nannocystis sp.]